jgi:hypothetical protein
MKNYHVNWGRLQACMILLLNELEVYLNDPSNLNKELLKICTDASREVLKDMKNEEAKKSET